MSEPDRKPSSLAIQFVSELEALHQDVKDLEARGYHIYNQIEPMLQEFIEVHERLCLLKKLNETLK
jgi:hypothetical protein